MEVEYQISVGSVSPVVSAKFIQISGSAARLNVLDFALLVVLIRGSQSP